MENFAKVVSDYLVANTVDVTFPLNASVIPVGMVFFALNVSDFSQLSQVSQLVFLNSVAAICKNDCHQTRGYCDSPGECRCRLGWAGPTCKDCQVLPGCQHGTCSKPLECKCLPGYTGILCQNGRFKCP